MDAFLGSITQHAMNYAIRSGIAITSTYTIRQCTRLLRTVEDTEIYHELQSLQERLQNKTQIISPAIDMIELISARGNTTLESAVSLTKGLRWDIQSLGTRIAEAATTEELSRRVEKEHKPSFELKAELRLIVQDIKELLARIEDAVPLINLAITTSGVNLSTSLPPSVSPSRLLQASMFLTAGDTQFSVDPTAPTQVGPAFILSVYMLFAGHMHRPHEKERDMRDTTWKEIIHKARVRLVRVPSSRPSRSPEISHLESGAPRNGKRFVESTLDSHKIDRTYETFIPSERIETEFTYQVEIIEDFNDGRVHSFEDSELQPEAYEDIELAGIREHIPIHQFSRIFYADTGRILNIGADSEVNSPVLLFKRDVNAQHPRRMMESSERQHLGNQHEDVDDEEREQTELGIGANDFQANIDHQLHSESSIHFHSENEPRGHFKDGIPAWRFPRDLDPEWLALEVYTDTIDDSSDDDQSQDANDDSTYISGPVGSSGGPSYNSSLNAGLENLRLESPTPKSPFTPEPRQTCKPNNIPRSSNIPALSMLGPVRSSLSLFEMLIRLATLQQFKQTSHLSIPDELLNFFLFESSTSGAGMDNEQRRRTRYEAKQKLGFDPYDDTPRKRRDDTNDQAAQLYPTRSRGGTLYTGYDRNSSPIETYSSRSRGGTPYAESDYYDDDSGQGWPPERRGTPQDSPEKWLIRSHEHSSGLSQHQPYVARSPLTPSVPRRPTVPKERMQQASYTGKKGSPLGRGRSVETDSSLGTSPGTPSLGNNV